MTENPQHFQCRNCSSNCISTKEELLRCKNITESDLKPVDWESIVKKRTVKPQPPLYEIGDLWTQLHEAEARATDIKERNTVLNQQILQADSKIDSLKARAETSEKAVIETEKDRCELRDTVGRLSDENKELKARWQKLKTGIKSDIKGLLLRISQGELSEFMLNCLQWRLNDLNALKKHMQELETDCPVGQSKEATK